jgi:hypothetical protein
VDTALWKRHVAYLEKFSKRPSHADEAARLDIAGRLKRARKTLEEVEAAAYLKQLRGMIGTEPLAAYR